MVTKEIVIAVDGIRLSGNLTMPSNTKSIVIFSHGSGSSRFSPRNNYVAQQLNEENISTLLVDLLTVEEDMLFENRFDIELLTERLIGVTEYIKSMKETKDLYIGYFGASTGAASALRAAAKFGNQIHAVVSRGGRPDLSGPVLQFVSCPVLLIIGSLDKQVISLNRIAFDQLTCQRKMEIVDGATHLFEEPGKLEEVAKLARGWFKKYLKKTKLLQD